MKSQRGIQLFLQMYAAIRGLTFQFVMKDLAFSRTLPRAGNSRATPSGRGKGTRRVQLSIVADTAVGYEALGGCFGVVFHFDDVWVFFWCSGGGGASYSGRGRQPVIAALYECSGR